MTNMISPAIALIILASILPSKNAALPARNFAGSTAVDATLTNGAVGEDVVYGCIEKLNQLAVFPNDFGLMYRIAKVETDFGNTYGAAASVNRGIWQISSSQIAYIEANVQDQIVSGILSSIRSCYGDSFVDFQNFDMTIPFHSAIAARIYIRLALNNTSSYSPGSVSSQAAWWSSNYRFGGDRNQFVSAVNSHESTKGCSSKLIDLWFLLDDSSSVGDRDFQTGLDFVRQIARKFVISPNNARVGFSLYSSATTTVSKFNEHTNNLAFESAVNSTIHQRGRTFTGAAINDVIENGFTVTNGARGYVNGVPRVIVLLTDGYSSDGVTAAVTNARSAGITLFAIGIGEGTKQEEINAIASYPSSSHAYNVEQYDDLLTALVERLPLQFCRVSSFLATSSSTFTSASSSYPGYIYSIISTSASTKIEVTASAGSSAIIYLSSIPNPTSSFHIASAIISPGLPVTLIVSANAPTFSTRSSGGTQEITLTGFQDSSVIVPLYVTISSTNNNVQLEFEIIADPEDITTTATTTSTTTFTPDLAPAPPSGLEWWAILAILFAVLFFIFIIICITLLAVGISRSSKYPACSDSVVCSFCACVAKSATY